jgi:hypothetical protein
MIGGWPAAVGDYVHTWLVGTIVTSWIFFCILTSYEITAARNISGAFALV